jgi:Ca2+-binding RTX toxin-like protein
MTLSIVDPSSIELVHLASVDVKFSGAHIGGGIYFSANHNPTPGGSSTAIPQRSLIGEDEQHSTTEYDYTLPPDGAPWDAYREDLDDDGTLDFVLAGFDMSLHAGDRLVSTGDFYDGPAISLLIANDPNDLDGTVTITGYPSAANSLDGANGTLHETIGTLPAAQSIFTGEDAYTEQIVSGDIGGYFTIDGAEAVGGMSGGGTFLEFDADGDGIMETYLIGAAARGGFVLDENDNLLGTFVQSTSFSPHYADLAAAIQSLQGLDARTADDFPRMTLLSAQTQGSPLTTVYGQFFHEDIFGGINNDTLHGGEGNDNIVGAGGADFIDGGVGNDTLVGGTGDDWFATTSFGNGFTDIITDFEEDRDVIDLSDHFSTLDDVINATTELGDGSIWVILPAESGGGFLQVLNTTISDLTSLNVSVICFVNGTEIETVSGARNVETLQPGDLVLTYDGAFQPILAVQLRTLSLTEISTRPHLWPIVFSRGSLGAGVPTKTLRVSPQHRILIDNRISARMVDGPALVAAKKFLGAPGIWQSEPSHAFTYVHLIFKQHEIICSNDAWTESFLPGPEARKCSTPKSIQGYDSVFEGGFRHSARIVEGKMARKLMDRHLKNGMDFQFSKGMAPV